MVSDIPTIFSSYNLVVNGFSDISREITNLKESCLYIEYLKEILEYDSKIETNDGCEIDTIDEIEFINVSFKYPHSENYVIKNINLDIKKGQKVAIVGINGAGKTTLIKLLLRYYDPSEGEIRINNISIKKYNIKSLRDKVATLFQDFQPYSISIGEIISCNEIYDDHQVTDVLKEVGLSDKVTNSPNGNNSQYSKMFDENGLVFSGGELQKLFIARMRYKKGQVYIMDEPSSSLDPISEYEIHTHIMKIAKNNTVIMISHRLSTTVNADNIVLIEDGELIECGTHEELLARNGKYAHMFNIQAMQYQKSSENN